MNPSKKHDPRSWDRWRKSGAVVNINEVRAESQGNIDRAAMWLGYARSPVDDRTSCIAYVREYLAREDAELATIGTSEAELQRLLINGYIGEAKKWLGYARRRTEKNDYDVIRVREYMGKAGTALVHIGTSEEELQQLLIDGYIGEARKWLDYARNPHDDRTSCIKYIREYLAKANAKLEDIGTSEKELQQLLIDGYIGEARKWLGYARNRNSENESCVGYVRKYISKAGVNLEAIGTSEEELHQLLIDGNIAEARMWLGYARWRNPDNKHCIRYTREYLAKAGVDLSAIGTSEGELQELLRSVG